MPRSGPPKRRKPVRARAPQPGGRARMQWRGFVDTDNVRADRQHLRFYKAETFQTALARMVSGRDLLIAPAIQALAPGADPGALTFELHYEFEHALVFHATAAAKGRKPVAFRLIAAKDNEERALAVRRMWKALKHAHARDPAAVAQPLANANVFLPDRHRRVEKGRDIFCCVTSVLPNANPLCVARGSRLAERLHAPKLLTVREEGTVSLRLIELAARLYDPKAQTGIILPDLARNQVEVFRKGKSVRLLLALPDGLRTRLTVPRFVHELVSWNAAGAGTTVRIKPRDLDEFVGALKSAVGRETAEDWLTRYKRSVVQGKLPAVPPLLPDDLAAIGIP